MFFVSTLVSILNYPKCPFCIEEFAIPFSLSLRRKVERNFRWFSPRDERKKGRERERQGQIERTQRCVIIVCEVSVLHSGLSICDWGMIGTRHVTVVQSNVKFNVHSACFEKEASIRSSYRSSEGNTASKEVGVRYSCRFARVLQSFDLVSQFSELVVQTCM